MKKIFVLIIFSVVYSICSSQPGQIDFSFCHPLSVLGDSSRFDHLVLESALQPDSKLILVGEFTRYNGSSCNYIIRLNPDGNPDTSFHIGTGFDYPASLVTLQSTGRILVAGNFSSYKGQPCIDLARLEPNGDLDTTFHSGTGFDNVLSELSIQPSDDKILVGGRFNNYNGFPARKIIRLLNDGTVDTTFNSGLGFDFPPTKFAFQSDGKIIIGGDFTIYDTLPSNHLLRVNPDGSRDFSFQDINLYNPAIRNIVFQPDSQILVCGYLFYFPNSSSLIRLNSNGTVDTSLHSTYNSFNHIDDIALRPDGKIVAYGQPANCTNGTFQLRLFDIHGEPDSNFFSRNGFDSYDSRIYRMSNGDILLAGQMTNVNNVIRKGVALTDSTGWLKPLYNVNTGFDGDVLASVQQPDGKLLFGGLFSSYDGYRSNCIIRMNLDGSIDTSLHSYFPQQGIVDIVFDPVMNKIYAAGTFESHDSVYANSIIRLHSDGNRDTSFSLPLLGFPDHIYTIALQSDGKILAGGDFYNHSKNIRRYTTSGLEDTSFAMGTGFDYLVNKIAVQPNGEILVGGNFLTYNSDSVKNPLRLNTDGSIDSSFHTPLERYSHVNDIVLQPDDRIIVGGGITVHHHNLVYYSACRLNTNGTLDTTFSYNNTTILVEDIELQPDGKLFLMGNKVSFQDVVLLVNSDGSADSSFYLANWDYKNIMLDSDGKLLLTGNFLKEQNYFVENAVRIQTGISLFVEDAERNEFFTLFPNPSGNKINLYFNDPVNSGHGILRNVQGLAVEEFNIHGGLNSIELKCTSGIYFINIRIDGQDFTRKVIVQN